MICSNLIPIGNSSALSQISPGELEHNFLLIHLGAQLETIQVSTNMFGCFALITNMSEKSSFNLFLVCFSSRNKLFSFRRKLIFLNFRDFSILRMSRHKIFFQTKLTCDFRERCKKIKFVYGIDTKARMETAEEEFFFFRTAVL